MPLIALFGRKPLSLEIGVIDQGIETCLGFYHLLDVVLYMALFLCGFQHTRHGSGGSLNYKAGLLGQGFDQPLAEQPDLLALLPADQLFPGAPGRTVFDLQREPFRDDKPQ